MKNFSISIASLFFFLTLIISCNNSDSSNSSDKPSELFEIEAAKKEIDKANHEFINLFNSGDSVSLANMFTVDGKSMEPNGPDFVGRSQIQTHYSNVMKMGANKMGLVTTGLWGGEDMLVEEGEYTFMGEDGKQLDKGKYLVLWKMVNGSCLGTAIILICHYLPLMNDIIFSVVIESTVSTLV